MTNRVNVIFKAVACFFFVMEDKLGCDGPVWNYTIDKCVVIKRKDRNRTNIKELYEENQTFLTSFQILFVTSRRKHRNFYSDASDISSYHQA